MTEPPLNVLVVIGSLNRSSVTRIVMRAIADQLRTAGCTVDVLDLHQEPLALFNPDSSRGSEAFARLKPRVEGADVLVLGSPDYHGSISSALKNFLDHFWQEFAGKLFASVVASHDKGLTVTDQLRTVARQCYAWTLPYGVSFVEDKDVREGQIVDEAFRNRLTMLVRDVRIYGVLLAQQRRADLAGDDPGFMARHRT